MSPEAKFYKIQNLGPGIIRVTFCRGIYGEPNAQEIFSETKDRYQYDYGAHCVTQGAIKLAHVILYDFWNFRHTREELYDFARRFLFSIDQGYDAVITGPGIKSWWNFYNAHEKKTI